MKPKTLETLTRNDKLTMQELLHIVATTTVNRDTITVDQDKQYIPEQLIIRLYDQDYYFNFLKQRNGYILEYTGYIDSRA